MRKAAAIDGVDWLRVLYCYPDETNDELLDVLAETDNVCPYLDIPVQHINADLLCVKAEGKILLRRFHASLIKA